MKENRKLALDVSLINNDSNFNNSDGFYKFISSPLGTTFRNEGISIGKDYMRFHGNTLSSSLSPQALLIEETIGKGNCSVVTRARHIETKEPFALKMFQINDRGKKDMLVKELNALCSLQCDCLVSLIGAFYDATDATISVVLEYMDRGSLEDILRKPIQDPNSASVTTMSALTTNGLPVKAIVSISYQILWGLGFLHHEKMTHRDVKPANVLLNSAGQVKLSDFGITSKKKERNEMNMTVVGTTYYMSPERLRASPYTTSSDIWSLGLIILECLSGASPFKSITSLIDLLQTIEESQMADLIPEDISRDMREVVEGCLHKIPERRIPANILLSSPWFSKNNIASVEDASSLMISYIERNLSSININLLSTTTKEIIQKNK